ncbi:polysaccharide pyruvyl transferase family protein [Halotia branconii]|uniref:Polysaccharide pyruvyl transferase family protein n=1 Tax=Halotia branconii CENA392 TaxID=1539056 RepID=A0AAJ6NVY6_9CYAN|nr:polysaccharide pyruvyl transferase family protein [Halotia branconii]WGV27605.1 polysaccharide pyruvyl transferase family protein [Halotia branconii CENA392]
MIVEIRGINFKNKGAELMLHAVIQKLSDWNEENIVAIRPKTGTYKQRSQLGLYQLITSDKNIPFLNSAINTINYLMPQKLRHSLGLITYPEIDSVLDASGFAYSDQWNLQQTVVMANLAKKCKREGKKVILLPQAFGPFENPQLKKAFIELLDNADLVFSRDEISYKYLMDLGANSSLIKMAPDFTNLVKGSIPEYFDTQTKRACIIPNTRMLDKTSGNVQSKYLSYLETCLDFFTEVGLKPFILIHDTTDNNLGTQMRSKFGESLEVISESNPLYIKGILGKCHSVVSSRFHGLISALSQGIPCLATGWSHKYRILLEDYNCVECLVTSFDSQEKIRDHLKLITEDHSRSELIDKINKAGLEQKKLSYDMWSEVYKVLTS